MKQDILNNLNNPAQLEKLYRTNKLAFKQGFSAIYENIIDYPMAAFWNARLQETNEGNARINKKDLVFLIVACLFAGTVAKLPALLSVDKEFFFTRNAGFVIFPVLMAYFALKNKLSATKVAMIAGLLLICLFYINLLPGVKNSDTLLLASIHLLLVLWSLLGFAFTGEAKNNEEKRLSFLRYNGDLIVMTGLIVIAGGILTAVSINLFLVIGLQIETFWFNNIVVFALPAAPILGTYLTQTRTHLVSKVSPLIAKLFSPLVLVMLVVYLAAMLYSGKDPYTDRDFLLIFNALLIGVMFIIFFSTAETSEMNGKCLQTWILLLLSSVTVIVNTVALTAIVFRISEWGITPNRAAVLGGNILILINLVMVAVQLTKVVLRKSDLQSVKNIMSFYLPVYSLWAIIVTFLFPLLFGFK